MERVKTDGFSRQLYRYHKGEVIVKEGDHSSIIYILMSGVLGVYKGGEKINEISGKGLVFGEMSSILDRQRTTSVIAEIESDVMVYRGGIQGLSRRFPSVVQKIMAQAAERLAEMNEKYTKLQIEYNALREELQETKMQLSSILKRGEIERENIPKSEKDVGDADERKKRSSDKKRYMDDGYILGFPSKRKTDPKASNDNLNDKK